MRYWFVSAALWAAVAACTPSSPPSGLPRAEDCAAPFYRQYDGLPVSALPQPRPGQVVRVIGPNQAVTQDYSPTRLNISVNGAGRMVGFTCG